MLARPWSVAHATVATRSGSPATTSPAAWPSAMSASGAAKARSAASRSVSPAPGRCLAANMSSSSAACAGGEADVGRRAARRAGVERRPGPASGLRQLAPEALEAVLGERVEQRLLVGEVAPRRGVADPELARELAQRQLAARRACAASPRRARAAPRGGCRGGRTVGVALVTMRQPTHDVVVDSIVVGSYIARP